MTELDPTFVARIEALQKYAADTSSSYRGKPTGGWAVPTGIVGDLAKPTSLTKPYDRDALNTAYGVAIKKEGTLGDIASLQRQISFLAMEERAARLRYASPSRLVAMAYARLDGQANTNGIFGKVKTSAESAAKAGGAEVLEPGVAT